MELGMFLKQSFRSKTKSPRLAALLIILAWGIFYTVYESWDRDFENPRVQKYRETLFPCKIWQIYLSPRNSNSHKFEIDPSKISNTASWLSKNPNYQYQLVGDAGAESFIRRHYPRDQKMWTLFKSLPNVALKSDFLRYLLLYREGGIYTDTDTVALQPISKWVRKPYQSTIRVVIGIEFDRLDGPQWGGGVHSEIMFSQYTIAATPGHPIFKNMLHSAINLLEILAAGRNTTISALDITAAEVIETTGPSAWTDVIWRQLQQYDPSLTSLRDLSGLTGPRIIGDIMILPINAFGMGQLHSNSANSGTIPSDALVRHTWAGSWLPHLK
ncbi:hypothetical protein QQS21_008460 [Conoideocrella luteorostrata]|uniref:Glycosyltransferase family 32 protein n=1 Tax=Conoideocrella luteorostrata TaxID=1105319 RepID=A0AAJ0CJ59_9HYPO|nr:hypothetical protein QQS21_008460 [Conoideocrella luteorostrata]